MGLSTGYNKIRTAVFISGTGSNLKSLIKFSKTNKSPISIEFVVSNNPKAKGLNYAKINKIKKKILNFKNKNLSEKELNEIHYLKTGKLIEACIVAVCVLKKDITDEEISKLVKFAQKFGLAFQIRDDILDVIGEEKDIGKPVGSDESKNKSTYASILGVPKSQEKAEKLSQEAINILKSLPYNTQKLQNLSNLIVERIR